MGVKVLSLDGSGSWAILQAMALKKVYSDTIVGVNCRSILNQFDIIAAKSSGSLMLSAMIKNAYEDIDQVIKVFIDQEIRTKLLAKFTTHPGVGLENQRIVS